MDGEKWWKFFWNVISIGFALLAIKAAVKPPDTTFFAIWTFSGLGAKALAEYGADWFDIW